MPNFRTILAALGVGRSPDWTEERRTLLGSPVVASGGAGGASADTHVSFPVVGSSGSHSPSSDQAMSKQLIAHLYALLRRTPSTFFESNAAALEVFLMIRALFPVSATAPDPLAFDEKEQGKLRKLGFSDDELDEMSKSLIDFDVIAEYFYECLENPDVFKEDEAGRITMSAGARERLMRALRTGELNETWRLPYSDEALSRAEDFKVMQAKLPRHASTFAKIDCFMQRLAQWVSLQTKTPDKMIMFMPRTTAAKVLASDNAQLVSTEARVPPLSSFRK